MSQSESFNQIDLNTTSFLQVSPQWASSYPDYRDLLQKQIRKVSRPFSSVSHCPVLGGALFSESDCGFDLEMVSRVQEKVVARVSLESEMKQLKSLQLPWAYLWSAKEASWKSTRNKEQPSVISTMKVNFLSSSKLQGFDDLIHRHTAVAYEAVYENEQKKSIVINGFCWTQKSANQSENVVFSVCFLQS